MRFLADENFPQPVIDRLRLSHDVVWAGTDLPSSGDKSLLERAEDEARILLTLDRDFWQLAVQRRKRMRKSGVLLFRVHPATPDRIEKLVLRILNLEDSWVGTVAVVTEEGIYAAPAGRSEY